MGNLMAILLLASVALLALARWARRHVVFERHHDEGSRGWELTFKLGE